MKRRLKLDGCISGTAVNNQLTIITDSILWRGKGKAMHAGLTADGVADLLSHVSDLVKRIRQEVVCFQEVEGADGQQLKSDAHVSAEIKPVQHLHAVAAGRRVDEVYCVKQRGGADIHPLTVCCLDRSA